MNLEGRFWSRVDASADCWLWTGARATEGYGRFYVTPRHYQLAHRYAWEQLVGSIPDGLQLDHLCRNLLCLNPDHLQPVSRKVNILRGYGPTAVRARQTHCIRGHEFTAENTLVRTNGYRRCRTCHRQDQFHRNRRNRAS